MHWGHLAFRAAMQTDVLATACFYATGIHKRGLGEGRHDNSLDRIGEIAGELLLIWGRQDPHIPREGRALIYHALSDAGTHFQWHEFNAAHVSLRDEGPRCDPAVARICYDVVLELFARKLALPGLAWVQVKPAAVEVDRRLEVLDVAEAASHALDLLDLTVERLAHRVGHRMLLVGQDVLDVPADRLRRLANRLQLAVRCPEVPPFPELPA